MEGFQRIFAAIDFSSGSDDALRQAHERAISSGAKLAVCHIVPNEIRSHALFPHISQIAELKLPPALDVASEAAAARVAKITGRTLPEFDLIVDHGAPYAAVLAHAEEWFADLIVVGCQGTARIPGMRLGGTALKVVQYAHCPVLIARPRKPSGRIVAGTDFSDPALPALKTAAAEAQRSGGELTVAHSIELVWPASGLASIVLGGNPFYISDKEVDKLEGMANAKLHDALNELRIDAKTAITRGPAEIALINLAARLEADLLIVGTIGRTGLRRVLLGSVAETVATEAPCSVLMVRLHRK